jgi:hypothetical protein
MLIQVVFISLLTGVLMNVMITRPLIHEMRDNFQERSRELVHHFQNNKEQAPPPPTPPPLLPTCNCDICAKTDRGKAVSNLHNSIIYVL